MLSHNVCVYKICLLEMPFSWTFFKPFESSIKVKKLEDFNGHPHSIRFVVVVVVFFFFNLKNPILIGSASAFSCTVWAALHSTPLIIIELFMCFVYTTQILFILVIQKYYWILFSPCNKKHYRKMKKKKKKKKSQFRLKWFFFFKFSFGVGEEEWGL